jgi:D-beta-D-heptose 7-phosphate kinase/D-beta-D-heptose 1-phosphate adenosyltransferase
MHEELNALLDRVGRPRICVVGDVMLDTYVWGQVSRVSPEGPIPILHVDRTDHRPGGAGSVTAMLRALEADVACVGVVGEDATAGELRAELESIGADATGLLPAHDRPTTRKTRYLGYVHSAGRGLQQIVRVDEEVTDPIPGDVAEDVLEQVRAELETADLLLIQDMAKGLFTPPLLQDIIRAGREAGRPVVVDPGRDRDYDSYRGATCLLPNRQETERAMGMTLRDEGAYQTAARRLVGELDLQAAVVTLDREGMFYATHDGEERHVATNPRSVLDVTGAGDMVATMIALALAGELRMRQAVELSNIAAGMEVSRQGAAPVSRAELIAELEAELSPAQTKIKSRQELDRILAERRQRGETVAFTNGVFDLLHLGHVELIRFASRQADILVVGVNSDESTRKGKGESRPIVPQDVRARTLASFPNVDYVVIFDEKSVLPLVQKVRPDVLVKGGDYDKTGVVGWEFVESYGGQVMVSPKVEGLSTTEIIRRIGSNDSGQ